MESYEKLVAKIREMLLFQSGIGIIRWDLYTQMPPKGMKQRSELLALMSKYYHRMSIDKEVEQLVSELEKKHDSLSLVQNREVELVRRMLDRHSNIPEDLNAVYTKQSVVTTAVWNKAKSTNNWKLFEPELIKLLDISKTVAEIRMKSQGSACTYDTSLDVWEPKTTSKHVSKVFVTLRKQLVPLVKKYSAACEGMNVDFKNRKVPIESQKVLIQDIASVIGYDTTTENAMGRIDTSEHPFTTGFYEDVRFTVNFKEEEVFSSLYSGLHESGHAIHSQNLNPDWKWMLTGRKSSSAISESQSRFTENMIGRSPEFWEFYYPRFRKHTNKIFKDVSYQEFLHAINQVKPSRIRVMADEMTYALHIIIRFEIEKDLFDEKIEVEDIPEIWNSKFEKYLGVEIRDDSEGALQDVHWAWAYWGYFPTYTLGNLYSAMIWEKLTIELPEWKSSVREGNIASPMKWLIENVHRKSNLYDPSVMIKEITGKSLTADPFITYLDEKYSALFG